MNALRRPSTAVNALLALLVVGAAFWGWTLLRDTASETGANASLRSVTVGRGTVTKTVRAGGSVRSAATATATFATAGAVTDIKVKGGDRVKSGQLLARVDDTAAKRSLELARADLTAARDALNRAQGAGADPGSAANEVARAQLAVDQAEAAVAGTKLTAPMAGTVTAINGTLGSPGRGGDSGFIDIADLTKLQVTAAFPEKDATELKDGQTATVTWNALRGAETTGQIVAVDPTARATGDPQSAPATNGQVRYGVTVSLPRPPAGAKPGQTVTVAVVSGTAENAVLVNPAAVTSTGSRHTVTVLGPANRQETRQVEIGLQGDTAYQIVAGLTAGERVLVPTRAS